MALFEWPRKPLPQEYDGWNYNPLQPRKCPACGHVGRPRMTGLYRAAIALLAAVFLPLIWALPWYSHSYEAYHYHRWRLTEATAIFILVAGLFMLIRSRNAYRCAKCDGILW